MRFSKARLIALRRNGNIGSTGDGLMKLISKACALRACVANRSSILATSGVFCRLLAFAGRKAEIGVDHPFHLDKIRADCVSVVGFAHQFQLQTDACQGCAKVMTDASQHLGAFVQLAHDPMAHCLKGTPGKPHFACALRAGSRVPVCQGRVRAPHWQGAESAAPDRA